MEKYSDYIVLFDESVLEPWTGINDYITALFSGMEIRRQEHLVKKVHTIHQLLFDSQKKKDFSFLCFELLLAVLLDGPTEKETAPFYYAEEKSRTNEFVGYTLQIENTIPDSLKIYIRENWTYRIGIYQDFDGRGPHYTDALDIPILLIGYSELIYRGKGVLSRHPEYSKYAGCIDDLKAVKRMLEIIK